MRGLCRKASSRGQTVLKREWFESVVCRHPRAEGSYSSSGYTRPASSSVQLYPADNDQHHASSCLTRQVDLFAGENDRLTSRLSAFHLNMDYFLPTAALKVARAILANIVDSIPTKLLLE